MEKKRIPRIAGLTMKVAQLRKAEGPDIELQYNSLKSMVLYQWFLNKGILCGTNYNQGELAQYIGCTIEDIQIYLRDSVMSSQIWSKDNQEKLVEGMLGQQFNWIYEDRMLIQQQVQILMQSQGGVYKPFISSEVSKALKLQLESTTSAQSFIRTISGGGSLNVFNQFNTQNNIIEEKGITYGEALEIISNQQKELTAEKKDETIIYLENKYDSNDLPEVNARIQTGNFDKEGISEGTEKIKQIVDYNSTEIAKVELIDIVKDRKEHEIRRQKMYGESDEDIDPEINDY